MNKLATKIVIVCCDRLLLAHSANFIKLTFMVIEIFLMRLFCGPRLLRRGQLPHLAPLVTPLAEYDVIFT